MKFLRFFFNTIFQPNQLINFPIKLFRFEKIFRSVPMLIQIFCLIFLCFNNNLLNYPKLSPFPQPNHFTTLLLTREPAQPLFCASTSTNWTYLWVRRCELIVTRRFFGKNAKFNDFGAKLYIENHNP